MCVYVCVRERKGRQGGKEGYGRLNKQTHTHLYIQTFIKKKKKNDPRTVSVVNWSPCRGRGRGRSRVRRSKNQSR